MYKYIFYILLLFAVLGCKRSDKPQSTQVEQEQMGEARIYPGRTIPYSEKFRDNNHRHIAAAEALGISPVATRAEAEKMHRKLREVKTCDYYIVDPLTHSMPYLVPDAYEELQRIGKGFAEILQRNDMPLYRFRVTSILRTDEDIKSLQRGNVNSISNSAHRYGTTFDIAYLHYDKRTRTNDYTPEDNLKLVLGQVLLNEQRAGRIYVKYEWRQGCFHITTIKN